MHPPPSRQARRAAASDRAVFIFSQIGLPVSGQLRVWAMKPRFRAKILCRPIRFHEYLGNGWGVAFLASGRFHAGMHHRAGFYTSSWRMTSPSCNVKVLALSSRSVDSHKVDRGDINDTQGTTVNFPILADDDRKVSELYDMIHPNASATATVRSVFIIDPAKKVRLIITYPASTGRNFNEILRVIDSLQLHRQPQRGHAGELAGRR